MKLSIIIGTIHIIAGLILNLFNRCYSKKYDLI